MNRSRALLIVASIAVTLLLIGGGVAFRTGAAGTAAGDQIRSVGGRSLRDVSFEQAVRMLHGKPGTSVQLGILHSSEGLKREEIPVRRAKRIEAPFRVELRGETAVLSVAD